MIAVLLRGPLLKLPGTLAVGASLPVPKKQEESDGEMEEIKSPQDLIENLAMVRIKSRRFQREGNSQDSGTPDGAAEKKPGE